MKRLKKRAWTTIDLYHFTSSQIFMKVMNEGQLTSGGYNNSTSGGGHIEIVDFAGEDTQGNKQMQLRTLDSKIMNSGFSDSVKISQELIDYVEQRQKENPDGWGEETIEISSYSPSYNEIGVYLTKNKTDDFDYADSALRNNIDESIPNFKVALKINVQTDALVPDYDDLELMAQEVNRNAKSPLWKQSLDRIGQVAHQGPIDASAITSVQFMSAAGYDCIPGNKFTSGELDEDQFYDWAEQYIEEYKWYSTSEAKSILDKLIQDYQALTPETFMQTASKKTRLKKKGL